MERIEKIENLTKYFIGDMLLLSITDLGNNNYIVENKFNKLEGYCKNVDEYRTAYRLDKNYSKGKNDRWYSTKKLFSHNASWFTYILQEKCFVPKTLPLY